MGHDCEEAEITPPPPPPDILPGAAPGGIRAREAVQGHAGSLPSGPCSTRGREKGAAPENPMGGPCPVAPSPSPEGRALPWWQTAHSRTHLRARGRDATQQGRRDGCAQLRLPCSQPRAPSTSGHRHEPTAVPHSPAPKLCSGQKLQLELATYHQENIYPWQSEAFSGVRHLTFCFFFKCIQIRCFLLGPPQAAQPPLMMPGRTSAGGCHKGSTWDFRGWSCTCTCPCPGV